MYLLLMSYRCCVHSQQRPSRPVRKHWCCGIFLVQKYSNLPGVRKLHDFLIIVKAHDGQVVMKVRERCFTGYWRASPLRVVNPSAPGTPTVTYKDAHTLNIKEDKMANKLTMYNRFISPCRRPDYLPPFQQPPVIPPSHQPSTSSASTSVSLPELRKCK